MKFTNSQLLTLLGLLTQVYGAPAPSQASVAPAQNTTVVQHRLAYLGDFGMTVSWNTFSEIEKPTISYGLKSNELLFQVSGSSNTYPTSSTWNNHVELPLLIPKTTYYYKVENDDVVYNFTTAPIIGNRDEFAFAYLGDMGAMGPLGLSDTGPSSDDAILASGEQNTMQSLISTLDQYEFIIHGGDLAYADYWLKEELADYLPFNLTSGPEMYEAILNEFYDGIQPLTSVKPYMVAPGNHDANCDNGGSGSYDISICLPGQLNFTGYLNHWNMPSSTSKGVSSMWYSYNYGMVHFVHMDTETDLGNGLIGPDEINGGNDENAGPFGTYENEQVDWLANDLKSVDRFITPWVIVIGHRPWYVSAAASDTCTVCQEAFEKILYENGVDVVMFGHVHNYERFAPTYNGTADKNGLNNPTAPLYIVNGAGGHYDGFDPLVYPLPPTWAYGFDTEFGWNRFTVHNATHLTTDFIAARNNSVLDTATLYKEHDFSFF